MGAAFLIRPRQGEALRRFLHELQRDRAGECMEAARRLQVEQADWYLQRARDGDLVILSFRAKDPRGVIAAFARSQEPFDRWFKDRARQLFGLDLDRPAPRPAAEHVFHLAPAAATSAPADPARREAEDGMARLEGALLAVDTLQHLISNSLSAVVGFAELLEDDPAVPPHLREYALAATRRAHEAAETLRQAGRLTRLELANAGGGPIIDLARSAE